MRMKSTVNLEENFNGAIVSIIYFKGRKRLAGPLCMGRDFGSINNNIDLCSKSRYLM